MEDMYSRDVIRVAMRPVRSEVPTIMVLNDLLHSKGKEAELFEDETKGVGTFMQAEDCTSERPLLLASAVLKQSQSRWSRDPDGSPCCASTFR